MEIKKTTETAAEQYTAEQTSERKEKTAKMTQETDSDRNAKVIIKDVKEDNRRTSSQGDQFISSEQKLQDATGLYSISHKSDGSLNIKFDDVKLQKKRNELKQEIRNLKTSSDPASNKQKLQSLEVKLANVEKKIRMQK